jgi:hypothetical protein
MTGVRFQAGYNSSLCYKVQNSWGGATQPAVQWAWELFPGVRIKNVWSISPLVVRSYTPETTLMMMMIIIIIIIMLMGWDCFWTVATSRPIVHPPGDVWMWKTMGEWVWQGKTPDSSTRALWQFYQQSHLVAKLEELVKKIINFALHSISFILWRVL